jgi:Tfp pilus assembly protein PilF
VSEAPGSGGERGRGGEKGREGRASARRKRREKLPRFSIHNPTESKKTKNENENRRGDPAAARDKWVRGVKAVARAAASGATARAPSNASPMSPARAPPRQQQQPRAAPAATSTSSLNDLGSAPRPNLHLYQSLAVLAAETGFMEEARAWFGEATRTREGGNCAALWHAWALAESRSGEKTAVRYLFGRGLEANPRSRYVFLSWALWEDAQGQPGNARSLFERGHELNPRDAPLLQAWARFEASRGSVAQARDLFDRASRADPRHLPVWQAWGLLEARSGDAARARELFRVRSFFFGGGGTFF